MPTQPEGYAASDKTSVATVSTLFHLSLSVQLRYRRWPAPPALGSQLCSSGVLGLFVCLFTGPVPATVTTLSQAASLWPLPARVATYWNASAHRRWVGVM